MDNRTMIWPDFRQEWIVRSDEDLVFVNKPCGVTAQSADPDEPDDLVLRLARFFSACGESPYLGVHQRLDKDTSGVVVFTRRKEVNADVAQAFEGRHVKKVYVACVENYRGKDGTWDDVIDGKKARSQVKIIERKGSRTMLEIAIETGRTHQIRIQLQKRGSPIAGDMLYGEERERGRGAARISLAPRLMLHALSLSIPHPRGGEAKARAPLPPEFAAWMKDGDLGDRIYDDHTALARALDLARERRWGLGRSAHTNAFRLVNEEGDALPRLAVDVYDAWAVAQFYGDDGPWASRERRERVLDAIMALGFSGVYVKIRPKQSNELVDTRREDLAPKLPVRGEPAPSPLVVKEEDAPLFVKLGDGLSTGVFLDQRKNRRLLRSLSKDAKVLNLFSYTCAFTVSAAKGGATETVSVDASPTALEWGLKNVLAAVGDGERPKHKFIAMDAFSYLEREAKKGTLFDLVVLDPPSYSSTKKRRFVASSDYAELLALAMKVTSATGKIIACCNHRGLSAAKLRRFAFDAGRLADRNVAQAKDLPRGLDYPSIGDPYMKSVLVTLAP